MKEEILKIVSKKEMSINRLKEEVKDEKLNVVLKEMEKSGLIFAKKDQNYSITLLGKILALGSKDVYESIVKRKDLFDFFKTRIPSVIFDELLSKFKFCEDFQIIGEPDLRDRQKYILNKAIGMGSYAEKEICVSAPTIYKPGILHMIAALKKRPWVRAIIPKRGYEKYKTFIKVSEKIANLEMRMIEENSQYIGLLDIDDKFCFFGFRTIENKPGWDAVIYTETRECIEWVKENFDYMWKNLAFSE
ncbi:MAG TPA: hypothetical protein ENG20_03130, partial [Methanomicrobia archaeon]|nr:hypothetical protein [Methanomicrobia archaeon]